MTHRDDALTSSEPMPGEPSPDDDVTVSVEIVAPLSGATMTLPRTTLAELEAAGVERPSIIRLMNDYGTPWPLWDAEGPMPQSSPRFHPSLEARIRAWARDFATHFDPDAGWDDPARAERHAATAVTLRDEIAAALDPGVFVALELWECPTAAAATPGAGAGRTSVQSSPNDVTMDVDTYRSMTIEQRAAWAEQPGPVAPDVLDLVLEDHLYVLAVLADANISEENLATVHERATDPVVRVRAATNPRAPLALMAEVPLADHTPRSVEAFLTRLAPGIIDHPAIIQALAGPWLDERPIGEVVVTALDEHTQPPA